MSCFCFRSVGNDSSPANQTIDEVFSGASGVKFYTYKELRVATQSFSLKMKVGEGGFGSVYKGRLSNGIEVAVKVLSAESRQGLHEFLTELIMVSNLEHDNLVKLYGCCIEENNRILVYGYLENNSLTNNLLGDNKNGIEFSWEVRKRIAIGVAKGLAYLHEGLRPHIIHRDIKASNILLDKDLNAKISDFGLAKLIAPSMTHISTKVAGTFGYLAPEYAMHGRLNRKADIYSFGVLLLEIVFGCRSRDRTRPPGEQYLIERAWKVYEAGSHHELASLVNEQLREDFDTQEAWKYLKAALLCAQETPKLRPSMSSVVKILQGKVNVDLTDVLKPGMLVDSTTTSKVAKDPKGKRGDIGNSSFSFDPERADDKSYSGSSLSTYPSLTITRISERSN
ncbi:hypothetical protein V2J09_017125 [Rumex salicifolius]